MSHALANLEPKRMFDYFYEVTQVPRPSKKEEKIRQYIIETAKRLNAPHTTDAAGNIVIRKPASPEFESVPATVLQGHLDMVCQKTPDRTIDFENDPIVVKVDGDWVKADRTTLGADNGIAVAAMLAILEDSSLKHGALELLFTIDEETGLTGALRVDVKSIKGRTMINLDSEEEGTLFVGCAGGKDAVISFPAKWKNSDEDDALFEIKISGGSGGHSGLDIQLGRANSIKILTQLLWNINEKFGVKVSELSGGTLRNAIPRDAIGKFAVSRDELTAMKKMFNGMKKSLEERHHKTDPHLKITMEELNVANYKALRKSPSTRLLNLLMALPHGVMAMSKDVEGLVETSVNLATIETTDKAIVIGSNQRSMIESEKRNLVDRVLSAARLAESDTEESDGYPGWKPNMESTLLKQTKEVFAAAYGKAPHVTAIHAGLECGIIGEKFPGMDMISFGPTIRNAHSPDECLYIPSVKPFYDCIVKLLEKIAQP